MGERWGIPRRNTELWESPNVEERWVETDPEKLAELTTERNKSPKVVRAFARPVCSPLTKT